MTNILYGSSIIAHSIWCTKVGRQANNYITPLRSDCTSNVMTWIPSSSLFNCEISLSFLTIYPVSLRI